MIDGEVEDVDAVGYVVNGVMDGVCKGATHHEGGAVPEETVAGGDVGIGNLVVDNVQIEDVDAVAHGVGAYCVAVDAALCEGMATPSVIGSGGNGVCKSRVVFLNGKVEGNNAVAACGIYKGVGIDATFIECPVVPNKVVTGSGINADER